MAKHPLAFEFCSQLVVECKHWRDLDVLSFLNGKGELAAAVNKVRNEAGTTKSWFLIARQNNRPICLLAYFVDQHIRLKVSSSASHILFKDILFFQLDKFLEMFRPEDIIQKATTTTV